MALTINSFGAANTGGFEETVAVSGSPVITADGAHSNQCYTYPVNGGNIDFPWAVQADAGNDYIIGMWVLFTDATPASRLDYFISAKIAAGNNLFSLNLKSDGKIDFVDTDGIVAATSATAPFTSNTWHFIEVYFQNSATADYEVFVDGTSVMSGTGENLYRADAISALTVWDIGNGGGNLKTEEWYVMSGATSAADRLGPVEVLAYRSLTPGVAPDWTKGANGDLNSGTWADVQSDHFESNLTKAIYSDTTARAGGVDTDDIGPLNVVDTGRSIDLSAGGNVLVNCLHFKADGTKVFYTQSQDSGKVFERTLSVAWDLSTAGSETFYDPSLPANTHYFTISSDGLKLYAVDTGNDRIYGFNLSTAWDLSSASADGNNLVIAGVSNMWISDDGTKIYINNIGGDDIHRWTMSTAYDISSATIDSGQTTSFGFLSNGLLQLSADGLEIWYFEDKPGNATNATAVHASLSVAWDLSSTWTTIGEYPSETLHGFGHGVYVDEGMSHIYFGGFGTADPYIHEYEMTPSGAFHPEGGPSGDHNIDGDSNIKAVKGVWRVMRSGGSGSVHYGLIGNTGTAIADSDRTADFDPTTAYANYFDVREDNLPLSTEFGRIGFEKDNKGQDLDCSDMLFQILHVPTPPATGSTGTTTQTLSSINQTATGKVHDIGQIAQTLASVTQTLSGEVWTIGQIVQVLPVITQSGTGEHDPPTSSGTTTQTLQPVNQSLTGEVWTIGTTTQTLPAINQSLTGTYVPKDVTSTATQTLPSINQSLSGEVWTIGTTTQTLPAINQSLTGVFQKTGTVTQTLQPVNQTGTATYAPKDVTSTATQTLPAINQSLTGEVLTQGTITQTLQSVNQTLTGEVLTQGTITQTLQPVSQTLTGVFQKTGTITQTLQSINQTGTATFAVGTFTGTITQTLASLNQTASATYGPGTQTGTTTQTLPAINQSLTGEVLTQGTITQTLQSVNQTLTGVFQKTGTATQTLQPVNQTGTATFAAAGTFTATATQTLQPVNQTGTATYAPKDVTSTITQTLSALNQAATGEVLTEGTITQTLSALNQTASATYSVKSVTSTAIQTLPALNQTASATYGAGTQTGTSTQTLQPVSASGSATFTAKSVTSTATQTLPAINQSLSGTFASKVNTGTITQALASLTQVVSATYEPGTRTGTASQTLPTINQGASGFTVGLYPVLDHEGIIWEQELLELVWQVRTQQLIWEQPEEQLVWEAVVQNLVYEPEEDVLIYEREV